MPYNSKTANDIPQFEGTADEKLRQLCDWVKINHPGRCLTLEEIGDTMGITRERVRQIEAKALKKLRHKSRSDSLDELFLEWEGIKSKDRIRAG